MTDVYDKDKRTDVMRKVKSENNKSTELRLIALFHSNKITGWRRHYAVIGKPDFVFMEKRIAIFVDGCFWHGHDCRNLSPATNSEYWRRKIERNKQHDKEITARLESRGWTVLRIWECELKKKNLSATLERIKAVL